MRQEIERRSSLVACLGLAVGIAAGLNPFLTLLFAPLLWLHGVRPRLLAAVAFLVGVVLAPRDLDPTPIARTPVRGTATVVGIPEVFSGGRRSVIRLAAGDFFLYHGAELGLSVGDELAVDGEVKPLPEGSDWARRKGVAGRFVPTRLAVTARKGGLARLGMNWREAFLSFSGATMSPQAAEAIGALCFNAGGRLDADTKTNLQRSGTMHIISVSGLHVMIFAVGVSGFLSLAPIPRAAQLAFLAALLAVYAVATGLQPPVVRAAVMAIVLLSAYLFRREPDLLSSLACAALVFLLWNPRNLLDIGFQLSFATVAALSLWMGHPPEAPHGVGQRLMLQVKQLAAASLIASVGSAPIVAYHFGAVSVISVLANLLIVAVLMPVTLIALAAFAVSFLSMGLAAGLMHFTVEPLVGWILLVVNSLGSLPIAAIDVPPFSGYWLIPIYTALLLTWRKRARQP